MGEPGGVLGTNLLIRRLAPILLREAGWLQTFLGAGAFAIVACALHIVLTPAMGLAYSNVVYLPAVAAAGLWFGFRGVAVFYVVASVLWWGQFWGHVPHWPAQFATFSIGVLMVGVFVALLKSTVQALDVERRALVESQRRYEARVNAGSQLFWATDAVGRPVERSRSMAAQIGDAPDADWVEAIHPEDQPAVREAWETSLATRAPMDCEYRYKVGDDWAWMRSTAVFDDAGGADSLWYGATENIDARRQAETARGLLMREVDHRSRNILSVVQALVRMTPRTDPEAYAKALEQRIVALAGAHNLLAKGRWRGAELAKLLEQELKPYHGACKLEGAPVTVRPEVVQPLALVVHELATNAAKYGALSAPGGVVTVVWTVQETGLALIWQEEGGPPAQAPSRKGFGSKLIAGSVKELTYDWREEGLTVAFRLKDAVVA